MEKLIKKTAIQIIHNPKDGKDGYLVLGMDEKAYADMLAGKDEESPIVGIGASSCSGKLIESITVELHDGILHSIVASPEK